MPESTATNAANYTTPRDTIPVAGKDVALLISALALQGADVEVLRACLT